MVWTAGPDWAAGNLATATGGGSGTVDMNLLVRDNFTLLDTHDHASASGSGNNPQIGPLVYADVAEAAIPANPAGTNVRFFASATMVLFNAGSTSTVTGISATHTHAGL